MYSKSDNLKVLLQEELRDLLHGEGNAKTAEKILLL